MLRKPCLNGGKFKTMKMEWEKFTQKWRKKRRKSDVKEKLASGTLPQCERIRLQKHQLGVLLYTIALLLCLLKPIVIVERIRLHSSNSCNLLRKGCIITVRLDCTSLGHYYSAHCDTAVPPFSLQV